MELYNKVAYEHAKSLTLSYSTSFGLSSKLFDKRLRPHIYAIYGLVRIADEIVDTYRQEDSGKILNELQNQVYASLKSNYSSNPIVHAFCLSANKFGINQKIISPFFESMRMDLTPKSYDSNLYNKYIYGSAEVIGLMCLKVFCEANIQQYKSLEVGAKVLGSAYQKVNFLRDLKADNERLGRTYFPDVKYKSFDEEAKNSLVNEIRSEFSTAKLAIDKLPMTAKPAVYASYRYYLKLLTEIDQSSSARLKNERIRVNNFTKFMILFTVYIKTKLGLL